jgi:hypothetical protein
LAVASPQPYGQTTKLRLPQHRIRIAQAIVGGIIAGFGARLAMGCNLAALPAFHSSRYTPGFLPSHSHRFVDGRPLYAPFCSAFR